MSPDLVVGIVGVAIGIFGIAAGIWAVRHWGTPKLRILFQQGSAAFVPKLPGIGASDLKVMYQDRDVEDPHMVVVRLINTGEGDVSSTQFDAKRPLTIAADVRFYGMISCTEGVEGSEIGCSPMTIRFMPLVHHKGTVREAVFVTAGQPKHLFSSMTNPLIDVDVTDTETKARVVRFLRDVVETRPEPLFGVIAQAVDNALSPRR